MLTNNLSLPLSESEMLEIIDRLLIKINGVYAAKHQAWRFFINKEEFVEQYNTFLTINFVELFGKIVYDANKSVSDILEELNMTYSKVVNSDENSGSSKKSESSVNGDTNICNSRKDAKYVENTIETAVENFVKDNPKQKLRIFKQELRNLVIEFIPFCMIYHTKADFDKIDSFLNNLMLICDARQAYARKNQLDNDFNKTRSGRISIRKIIEICRDLQRTNSNGSMVFSNVLQQLFAYKREPFIWRGLFATAMLIRDI